MEVVICADAGELARTAAALFRERVTARPGLAMAVPAGRTPRGMYGVMRALQASSPVDFTGMHVFSVDELCPPAPPDGYFWRQVRAEFLGWAGVPAERCHPFAVDREDLDAMCGDYERCIAGVGGLDVVMLGLGPNAHIASNEPPADVASRTRPVELLADTVGYILTDSVIQGPVCERAVTLGIATILEAREVVVLVSGAAKRAPLARALHGPESADVPASILRRHPRCTVIADREAVSMAEYEAKRDR